MKKLHADLELCFGESETDYASWWRQRVKYLLSTLDEASQKGLFYLLKMINFYIYYSQSL